LYYIFIYTLLKKIIINIIIFFYLLIIDRNPSELPSTLLDKNVPKFETESLLKDEKFISSKEFGNEILLVNFFATWCKPCRDEHIYIKRFSNEKEIKVIGINYKDNPKKAIQWLKELGNPYTDVAVDKSGRIDLTYKNKFTLLVSVVLSAQCTDVNVNNVTKNLYKKWDIKRFLTSMVVLHQ